MTLRYCLESFYGMSVALSLRFLSKKYFFECCGSNLEMEQGTVVFTNVAVVNLGSKKLNHNNANESQTRGFSFG